MKFLDIQDKINIIRRDIKILQVQAQCPETAGLFTLMKYEIDLKIQVLNGENWETAGEKNLTYRNYESSKAF